MHILLTLRKRRLAGALLSREARVLFTAEQWLGVLSLVQHVCDRFRLRSHGAELSRTVLLVSVPHTAAWIFAHSTNHARSHTDLQRRHLRANAESRKSSVCRWWIMDAAFQFRCWITDTAFRSNADWSRTRLTAQMLNHGRYLQFRYWITEVQMLTRRSCIEFICWLTDFAHSKWQKSATDTESCICTDADSQILHIVNDRSQLHMLNYVSVQMLTHGFCTQWMTEICYRCWITWCTDADSRILRTEKGRMIEVC